MKYMMTNVSALESAKAAILIHNDQMLQSVYSLALAIHLMIEKYELQSFWSPYINSLPKVAFNNSNSNFKVYGSPFYWDINTLISLEGSRALFEIAKVKAAIAKEYAHVYFRLEVFCCCKKF